MPSSQNPTFRLRSPNSLESCLLLMLHPQETAHKPLLSSALQYLQPSGHKFFSLTQSFPATGLNPILLSDLGETGAPAPSLHRRPRGSLSKNRHSSHPPTLLNLGQGSFRTTIPFPGPTRLHSKYREDGVGRDPDPGDSLLQDPGTRHLIARASLSLLPKTADYPDGEPQAARWLGPRFAHPLGSIPQDTASGKVLDKKRVPAISPGAEALAHGSGWRGATRSRCTR